MSEIKMKVFEWRRPISCADFTRDALVSAFDRKYRGKIVASKRGQVNFHSFQKGCTMTEKFDRKLMIDKAVFRVHAKKLENIKYFKMLFMKNKADKIVRLMEEEDVDPYDFRFILSYLYTGDYFICGTNVVGQFLMARHLGIQHLERECAEYMSDNLSHSNIFMALNLADLTSSSLLDVRAQSYLNHHLLEVSKDPEFLEVHPEHLQMVTSSDTLIIQNKKDNTILSSREREKALLEIILRYLSNFYSKHGKVPIELLKAVRLLHIDPEVVRQIMEPYQQLAEHPDVKYLVALGEKLYQRVEISKEEFDTIPKTWDRHRICAVWRYSTPLSENPIIAKPEQEICQIEVYVSKLGDEKILSHIDVFYRHYKDKKRIEAAPWPGKTNECFTLMLEDDEYIVAYEYTAVTPYRRWIKFETNLRQAFKCGNIALRDEKERVEAPSSSGTFGFLFSLRCMTATSVEGVHYVTGMVPTWIEYY